MLPNRFPDQGIEPEFNSVDASLWYVIAVHEYLEARRRQTGIGRCRSFSKAQASGWRHSFRLLAGNAISNKGRFGRLLLAVGEPGFQLTWMDAKVDGHVVTPRIGKPVEIQALWINALWIGQSFSSEWQPLFKRASEAFVARYWNEDL
jgi:predicted glycogen debranching enzyme